MISSTTETDLLPPKRARKGNDDNMIPMINIVFLLLIFFMIAGQISIYDRALVDPVSTSAGDIADDVIVLEINEKGQYAINSEPVTDGLIATLETLGIEQTDTIICRIHYALPASSLDPVLAAFKTLKVSELQLVTRRTS